MPDTDPSPPPEPAPPAPRDAWGIPVLGPAECLCQPDDVEAGCTCDEGSEW